MAKILLIEDQESYRTTLEEALAQDHEVVAVESGERALEATAGDSFDLVITDLVLGGMTGVEVVRHLKRTDPYLEVIVMTAYGTVESAVEAMKEGAYDYISKPFNLDEFQLLVSNALERRELRTTVHRLQKDLQQRYGFQRIIGRSAVMQEICRTLVKVAASDATVILSGESGTGKGLIARAIHHNSPRRERSFVEINCAGLPEPLLESELFGHARGAFTDAKVARKGLIEEATEGTFFLDEIGDASLAIQAKLLKVLEDGQLRRIGENTPRPVNVRFLAATNKDLKKEVEKGSFREDLFFRLHVVSVRLPALRERADDIPLLAHHFLGDLASRAGKAIRELSPGALEVMKSYPWPGNIRELRNVLEHAIIMTEGDVIQEADLPAFLRSAPSTNGASDFGEVSLSDLERRHIQNLLERKSDLGTVAKILGIGRTTLWRKMKEYGLRK
ncbi:MAG: sigma-54-dependent transcriptional regulator [Candidatus Binatia bacterium]